MGWEIYPEGFTMFCQIMKKYNLPIYITENGLADAEDKKRDKFIKDHLRWVHKAIQEGVNIRGYLYWSLRTISNGTRDFGPDLDWWRLITKQWSEKSGQARMNMLKYVKKIKSPCEIPLCGNFSGRNYFTG